MPAVYVWANCELEEDDFLKGIQMKRIFPIIVIVLSQQVFGVLLYSFNEDKEPGGISIIKSEIGWVIPGDEDFGLLVTGVQTRFSRGAGIDGEWEGSVTLEIYDAPPVEGGELLRSEEFVPISEMFSGTEIEPVLIEKGESFFLGFRDVSKLGRNWTIYGNDFDYLPAYSGYELPSTGTYDHKVADGMPILLIYGYYVPEPCSLLLLGAGVILLRRRR